MNRFHFVVKSIKIVFFLFLFFSVTNFVFASAAQGVIDGTSKYAWGENIGWVNFGCDKCNVQVTDSGLSGDAWSEEYGWINLSPSNSGVKNDGTGVLSGDAWSSNIGWIDFDGVTINTSGEFLGYATIKADSSKINFNCIDGDSCKTAGFKVKTDWRPASLRFSNKGESGGGYLPTPQAPTQPISEPTPVQPTLPSVITTPIASVVNNISNAVNSASDFFLNFFKPKNNNLATKNLIQIPKIAPLALNTKWDLLPVQAIHSFVFAPLPYEIRTLASKFPELSQTFASVGVERMTDMGKLLNTTLNIPGLAEQLNQTIQNVGVEKLKDINNINGVAINSPGFSNGNKELPSGVGVGKLNDINNMNGVAVSVPGFSNVNENLPTSVGVGKIAMIEGLPLAKFSLTDKKNLPSEFVFARTDGELVDLNVALSFNGDGTVSQKIASLPNQMMRLVVKPISKARSVTGYFMFQSATPKISTNTISRSSLTASALFSMNGLVQQAPSVVPVEQKLVLSSFEYTDPDHDGIYTADVLSPGVPGSYEVVTVIDYIDPELGVRKMSMITVVDPEGYVYEKDGDKETRIPSAIVALYHLNLATKQYELWPAKDYQQENPQITDVSGTYAFLVPEGTYYFQVTAPGYNPYNGKAFTVAEGGGIHENIELTSGRSWLSRVNWETVLLIVVILLLVYNLFKDKLSKIFKRT